MAGPSRPSFPAPSEPSLRRLGLGGGGGGGGDRPLRAQLVVALVVGLVLLAVPLYLWRRPSGTENAPEKLVADGGDAGRGADGAGPGDAGDADAENERVRLASVQRVKCSASPTARGQEGELCDRLDEFESALARSIRENVDCAPKTGKLGTINYVLTVDFNARRVNVFPGKSGEWRGPQARKSAECVRRGLVMPDWSKVKHQYRFYMVALMATYPPPGLSGGSTPLFE